MLEGFAVVVGGEEFLHRVGDIDFDEKIGVEDGIGDAVRCGDDGVSIFILAAEEEGIDAVDRGGGGCVDEEQMGAHFPIGMCEANDEGLEGDVVDVGQPGGADFVFVREDGFFRVSRVVGFRLHLDEVHGAAFLDEDVGADEQIAVAERGLVDCRVGLGEVRGGFGKGLSAREGRDVVARRHEAGEFANLKAALGQGLQKLVSGFGIGVEVAVVAVVDFRRAVEAEAVAGFGEWWHGSEVLRIKN